MYVPVYACVFMHVRVCACVYLCDIYMFVLMCIKYTECVHKVNVGCLPSPPVNLFFEAGSLTDSARVTPGVNSRVLPVTTQ